MILLTIGICLVLLYFFYIFFKKAVGKDKTRYKIFMPNGRVVTTKWRNGKQVEIQNLIDVVKSQDSFAECIDDGMLITMIPKEILDRSVIQVQFKKAIL